MKQINFKVIIIGLLISWGVEQLILLIQTTLAFLDIVDSIHPLVSYLLMWRFYLVITGTYIGFSKANNKIIHGAVVGILDYLTKFFLAIITISSPEFKFDLLAFGYNLLECGLICAIVSWGTYKIILRRKWGQTSTV